MNTEQMQQPIYYNYKNWESFYTPFGPVRASDPNEMYWVPQQVVLSPSYAVPIEPPTSTYVYIIIFTTY